MDVRIKDGFRGVDAWVVTKTLTVTKNWTTVTKSQAKKLLGLEYRGRLLFESRDTEADEVEVEEPAEETA